MHKKTCVFVIFLNSYKTTTYMKSRYYKILSTNIHTLGMNIKNFIDLELQKNISFTIYFVKILTLNFKLLNLCSTFSSTNDL